MGSRSKGGFRGKANGAWRLEQRTAWAPRARCQYVTTRRNLRRINRRRSERLLPRDKIMSSNHHGAFDTRHAQHKVWKVDPGLWRALCDLLPPEHPRLRIVDVGAGGGHYVHGLRSIGHHAAGIDGTAGIERISGGLVQQYDLTSPIAWDPPADWAISIEVGEHIPRELAQTYLNNLAHAATRGLVVSWATPGQRGRNHIHCQPPEWVIEQLSRRGWRLDHAATQRARDIAQGGWRRKLLILTPVRDVRG